MKKAKLILTIMTGMLISINLHAQQVVASAGGYFEGNNVTLSWTLGEPVTETFTGSDVILTQGFQQPYNFYITQLLNIPAGWSGVSGYVDPLNKGVEDIFSGYIPDFVLLASLSDVYYPAVNLNTIGEWDDQTGYQIRAENGFEFSLTGSKIPDPTVDLNTGWNIIPVMTSCGAPVGEVFGSMGNLNIVKEIAGVNMYWPDFGIQTLENLVPGKAYFVNMNAGDSFTYPQCGKNSPLMFTQEKPENLSPWNDPCYTAGSHAIAFPAEVLQSAGIKSGDMIGVFTPAGLCAGFTEITGLSSNTAVVAFSDDQTTPGKDGFTAGEMLQFRVYRPDVDEEFELEVSFNTELPNSGIFTNQGLSAVKSAALNSASAGDEMEIISRVYPNPSNGHFSLTLSHWPTKLQIHLMDTKGRVIQIFEPAKKHNGPSLEFHLNDLSDGVYFLKLVDRQLIEIKKIVIHK